MIEPRPAAVYLAHPEGYGVSWAVFDAAWYRARNPGARALAAERAVLLRHYLEHGAAAGFSPNPFFDEAWYRATHPAARAEGFASGFDHYCRAGFRQLCGHWLFDEQFYRAGSADLDEATLARHGCANRYDHYLKAGQREGRAAHPFFVPARYEAALVRCGERAGAFDAGGPFADFLRRQAAGLREPRVSPYFDPDFYRARTPEVAEARWLGALHHYLANESPAGRDPLAQFSESFYLAAHPDAAAAVARGDFRNGYAHFVAYGARERRRPAAELDFPAWLAAHPEAEAAVASGLYRDGFAYLVDLAPADAPAEIAEAAAKALFRAAAEAALPAIARRGLDFTCPGPPAPGPALSVVMVVHEQFALTMQALASLRENFAGPIELVLADNGSTDATRRIGALLKGARLLRLEANEGFLTAANRALGETRAPAVLLLNNDVTLAPGAVAAALARLDSEAAIGAVGGRVIRSHGRLQEAGCTVGADGHARGYLRDADPLAPEALFVRDVDFCSAVFLLVRADLLRRLGGFDPRLAPAYYEDADLCLRIAAAGYRVVYDPAVTVRHLEYGSAALAAEAEAQMRRSHARFHATHAATLAARAGESALAARDRRRWRRRVLFLEDTIPFRHLGSGFVRANDVVAALAAAGCHVGVFPVNGAPAPLAETLLLCARDLPETAEVFHDRTLADLPALLRERAGFYDLLWISRTHNFARIRPALADAGSATAMVLDTEALASAREAVRAALAGERFDLGAALAEEMAGAQACRAVLAVSQGEVALLRGLGLKRVGLLGTARAPAPGAASFAQRQGLLFLGAIHATDSPNLDALGWFLDAVLPRLAEEMEAVPELTIAGYTAPGIAPDHASTRPGVRLAGEVADLGPLYARARVFVAPTRFAAGTPYKLHEAAAFGLPIVATALLAQQMGWHDGEELLAGPAGDAAGMARRIAQLYRDAILWNRLRSAALARIARENAPIDFARAVERVVIGDDFTNDAMVSPLHD